MNVGLTINKKELAEIARNLESLNMSDSKNKTLLRQAMRKAAKPILTQLRANVDNIKPTLKGASSRKTGQLKKSLAVINGKNRKGVPPSVFVGPRVKGAYANENKTGFYFYFFEYGFRGVAGLRMLDDAARSKGSQALNDVTNQLKGLIEKRFKK
jgi:hypothetical protein